MGVEKTAHDGRRSLSSRRPSDSVFIGIKREGRASGQAAPISSSWLSSRERGIRLNECEYENYPTDHVITKTTCRKDPGGQEIELYVESPEDGTMGIAEGLPFARRVDGRPSDGKDPLDLEALFRELNPGDTLDQPIPPATRIGHVHLYVRNVPEAVKFYTEVIGFDDMGFAPSFMMGMVSVAGCHHHIGLNSWMGEGAPPPPPGSQGLRHFSIVLPDTAELDRAVARVNEAGLSTETVESGVFLRDPSQNGILLTV